MNYEAMSDKEINIAVATAIHGSCEKGDRNGCAIVRKKAVDILGYDAYYNHYADYCNNWGDAGPIIISAWRELNAPVFDCDDEFVCTEWQARVLSGENKNPLRAAMIVFLMMKDATK